jgi:dolichol-phosphate mannosyltransferase
VKISILIPVYNEFRTLREVLERVCAASLPEGCTKEIIVVDDGSTDGSADTIAEYTRAGIVISMHAESNAGKGAAIRAGITLASGDIILIQDGDLEYDPADYARIIEPILSGRANIVYGSRFLGNPANMAFRNLLANRILTAAANLLYQAGISDEATAYKAFRASILRNLMLECRRFEFCPEVTAKVCRLGFKITEVPISYNARGIADGKKIRASDGFRALWTLIQYRFVPLAHFALISKQIKLS